MQRFPVRVLGVLAVAALVMQAYLTVPAFVRELWSGEHRPPDSGFDRLEFAAWFIVQLLLGRLVLSFLPAGRPGSHDLRGLPATAAASYFLGKVAFALQARLALLPGFAWLQGSALALAPWAVLGAVRLATLPAGMVPGHALRTERAGPIARALFLLAVVWSLVVIGLDPFSGPWDWFAFVLLSAHALSTARRAPLGRALLLLSGALCVPALSNAHPALSLAAYIGIGAVSLVPWIRRADRRAGVLAIVAFASLAILGEPLLALAGLLATLLVSPAPQRTRVLATSLVAAALLISPWVVPLASVFQGASSAHSSQGAATSLQEAWTSGDVLRAALDTEEWGVAWIFLVLAGLPGLGILVRWAATALDRRMTGAPGHTEDPWREVLALALLLVLAYWALQLSRTGVSNASDAARILFPVALVLIGLVIIPAERPANERAA